MDRNPLPTQLLQPHDFQRWQRHLAEEKYELGRSDEESCKKLRHLIEEAWIKAVEHTAECPSTVVRHIMLMAVCSLLLAVCLLPLLPLLLLLKAGVDESVITAANDWEQSTALWETPGAFSRSVRFRCDHKGAGADCIHELVFNSDMTFAEYKGILQARLGVAALMCGETVSCGFGELDLTDLISSVEKGFTVWLLNSGDGAELDAPPPSRHASVFLRAPALKKTFVLDTHTDSSITSIQRRLLKKIVPSEIVPYASVHDHGSEINPGKLRQLLGDGIREQHPFKELEVHFGLLGAGKRARAEDVAWEQIQSADMGDFFREGMAASSSAQFAVGGRSLVADVPVPASPPSIVESEPFADELGAFSEPPEEPVADDARSEAPSDFLGAPPEEEVDDEPVPVAAAPALVEQKFEYRLVDSGFELIKIDGFPRMNLPGLCEDTVSFGNRAALKTKTWIVVELRRIDNVADADRADVFKLATDGFNYDSYIGVGKCTIGQTVIFNKKRSVTVNAPPDWATGFTTTVKYVKLNRHSEVAALLAAWCSNCVDVRCNFKVLKSAIDDAPRDTGVLAMLHELRGLTPIQVQVRIAEAQAARARKESNESDILLCATAVTLNRILSLERGDRPTSVFFYDRPELKTYPSAFDQAVMDATRVEYWDEEARCFQRKTLSEALGELIYVERTMIIKGPPNTGKTRLCLGLAGRVLEECRSFDDTGRVMPPSRMYALVVKTFDAMKDLAPLMEQGVPIVIDDARPSDRENQGVCPMDKLKALVDCVDSSTAHARYRDLSFAPGQPRFWTTNVDNKRTFYSPEWAMAFDMDDSCNMDIFLTPKYNDLRAVERRVAWVYVDARIIKTEAETQYRDCVAARKVLMRQNRERFIQR